METPRTKDVYYSLIILRRESHVLFIFLRKTKCLGGLGYRCSLRCVQRFWLIARNPKRTLASHGALSSVDHRHAATIISRASGAAGPQPSQLPKPKPPLETRPPPLSDHLEQSPSFTRLLREQRARPHRCVISPLLYPALIRMLLRRSAIFLVRSTRNARNDGDRT